MQDSLYWLTSITADSARVTLVNHDVSSQGQEIAWDSTDSNSLLKAIDTSLSSQNSEATSNCAFIIPPTWVSDDGKIFGEMLSKLKIICQSLKLKPLGFISFDDAFVESYNNNDSFPSSYILVNFSLKHYQISLVYLGVIKKRITLDLDQDFLVSSLQNTLANIEFESSLPPKIIITGTYSSQIVEDIGNFNWLSKNNVETFLHLPDVEAIDMSALDKIYIDTIQKQITPPEVVSKPIENIEQVEADALGFSPDDSPVEVVEIKKTTPVNLPPIKLPQISLPKIHFNYYWLLPLTLLPFLPVLPLFFAKADITIYQNQTQFNETFNVNLDPKTNVSQKTFDLSVGVSTPSTGKKEVGEKAKGEVVIYNKSDRSVSINKGLIITDVSGKKFETTNNILLPASTYNLDTGVINMGQVKATVVAGDIGPESNLPANTSLTVKTDNNLLAKTSVQFAGGTREQVAVITQTDRNNLTETAKQQLKNKAIDDINSQKSTQNSILESTMTFENQKSNFNREVGEVADILTLNLSSKVSFLYFDYQQKQNMVANLFSQKEILVKLDKNSAVTTLNYTAGKLTMAGSANPVININELKSKLAKSKESDLKVILNNVPGYYQYKLSNTLWFLNLLGRLPVNPNSIYIIIKN